MTTCFCVFDTQRQLYFCDGFWAEEPEWFRTRTEAEQIRHQFFGVDSLVIQTHDFHPDEE